MLSMHPDASDDTLEWLDSNTVIFFRHNHANKSNIFQKILTLFSRETTDLFAPVLIKRLSGNENEASEQFQCQEIDLSDGKIDVLKLFFFKFLCKAIIYIHVLNVTLRTLKYAAVLYYRGALLNRWAQELLFY